MSSLEMPAMNSQAQHRTYSCKSVAILAELSVYEAVGHQCFQSTNSHLLDCIATFEWKGPKEVSQVLTHQVE